jgi:hypothetical protein
MDTLLHGPSDGARYGECLSSGDHAHLRAFVHELVGKRLLPHLNEALKSLNEWVRKINCYTIVYMYNEEYFSDGNFLVRILTWRA